MQFPGGGGEGAKTIKGGSLLTARSTLFTVFVPAAVPSAATKLRMLAFCAFIVKATLLLLPVECIADYNILSSMLQPLLAWQK